MIEWLYGSGFPKSLDVSKAIDKRDGHWRGRAGLVLSENEAMAGPNYERGEKGEPVTAAAAAAAAAGWGTALKPAHEPIVVARKSLSGTVAENVMAHGTGALNIDGCRVKFAGEEDKAAAAAAAQRATSDQNAGRTAYGRFENGPASLGPYLSNMDKGRWPANVALDEEAAAMLDEQTGESKDGVASGRSRGFAQDGYVGGSGSDYDGEPIGYGGAGGASRFFYVAKASRAERNAGCEWVEDYDHSGPRGHALNGDGTPRPRPRPRPNIHPTVKPIDFTRWLVRLVTPPGGGTILDPFLGSGTTGIAALLEGQSFIGIEREPDYLQIAEARIAFWREHGEDGLRIVAARDAALRVREEIAAAGQLDLLGENA